VVISITDNGIGMSSEKLKRILSRLDRQDRKDEGRIRRESYGIYNVSERIKLKFGEQYGLIISSEYGKGTSIKVKIPFR
jgi:two-component system sensor histidine kinase YesM